MNCRRAGLGDEVLLFNLVEEFYKEAKYNHSKSGLQAAIEKLLQNEIFGEIYLIEQHNQVVGYVALTFGYSLEYQGRDAFIDELYLKPVVRKQGLGTQVLEFVWQRCEALSIKTLHLEVESNNNAASELYRRSGFRENQRRLLTKINKNKN